jgi:hypothetical protein
MEYRLLVYNIKGRHKLIRRFRSYWKMSEWISKNVKEENYEHYKIVKQKIK